MAATVSQRQPMAATVSRRHYRLVIDHCSGPVINNGTPLRLRRAAEKSDEQKHSQTRHKNCAAFVVGAPKSDLVCRVQTRHEKRHVQTTDSFGRSRSADADALRGKKMSRSGFID